MTCFNSSLLNQVSYVIKTKFKIFWKILSYPRVIMNFKQSLPKLRKLKWQSITQEPMKTSDIQHSIPPTESCNCQIVISVQHDYLEELYLNDSYTTEAHEISYLLKFVLEHYSQSFFFCFVYLSILRCTNKLKNLLLCWGK